MVKDSIEWNELKNSFRDEAIFLLSHTTSKFYNDRKMFVRLIGTLREFYPKHEVNKSCSSCIGKAYSKLSSVYDGYNFTIKIKKDMEELKETGHYLLKPAIDNQGYMFGRAMVHNTASEALRKKVYESHESRQSLFIPESIPVKEITPLKKTTKSRKKKSTAPVKK